MMSLPEKVGWDHMYESTRDAMWTHGIDLAEESDFDLGFLRIRPATCEVEWNGASQTLQRRVMQVLVALARARGTVVSQDDLVIRCWRGLSVSDDAIYRCISKLRKLAAGYPAAPYRIEAIPGVGYRLTAPGPSDYDHSVKSAASHERRFGPRAWVAAAALAMLLLVSAVIWINRDSAPDGRQPILVAVQSFDTLSNSEDARSLARRIPNEVVNELGDSQIETVLRKEGISRIAPANTGRQPGLIVTGLLRDDAPDVTVDVRVEDGATRAALWSMQFKRDRQALDLPQEVAARVADVVNMAIFARTAQPPLTDNSALSALLQATDMIRDTPDEAWAQMLQRAQGVVARHPEFAFGHSILAAAYATAADNITIPDRAQAMAEAARREANLTLKLDRKDAGAYAVLSWLEPTYDFRAREAILLRGIKFAKHPKEPLGALYSYEGTLLSNVGRLREALSYQLMAHATDEWGPPKTAKVALAYANMGNLPAARSWIQKGVRRWPNHAGVRRAQRYIAGFYEQRSDAIAIFESLDGTKSSHENQGGVWRRFIEARSAQSPRLNATAVRDIREAANHNKISRETEVMMVSALGETKLAIEAANLALDRQELQPWFLFTPIMRDVRRDPGFVGLTERMGLIKYWRDTGKLPDFCADRASRTECSPELLAALKPN